MSIFSLGTALGAFFHGSLRGSNEKNLGRCSLYKGNAKYRMDLINFKGRQWCFRLSAVVLQPESQDWGGGSVGKVKAT